MAEIQRQSEDSSSMAPLRGDPGQKVETLDTSLPEQAPSPSNGKQFAQRHGLDESHARLHDALAFIESATRDEDIEGIRGIVFKQAANAGYILPLEGEEPTRKEFKKKITLGKKEHRFNIQGVEEQTLTELLNSDESRDTGIPLETEIFSYVSPSTQAVVKALDRRLNERRIAYMTGPTGTGKTTLTKTLAYHRGVPLYQDTGSEIKTYVSLMQKTRMRNTPDGGRETFLVPSGLVKAALYGGIYLIDEFNYLSGDVQLAIAQIIDDNEIILPNGVRAPIHPSFSIVLTGNNLYGGTKAVNDAVLRRTGGELEVSYLPESEEAETVFKQYEALIDKINDYPNTKFRIHKNLSKEEIEKLVIIFRDLRETIQTAYTEADKDKRAKLSLEDGVSYSDQFSFRKVVDFITRLSVMRSLDPERTITLTEVFQVCFKTPPPGADVIIRNSKLQFNPPNFLPVAEEEVEETEEEAEAELAELVAFNLGLNPGKLLPTLSGSNPDSGSSSKPGQGKRSKNKRGEAPETEIPDFELFDMTSENGRSFGSEIETMPAAKHFANKVAEYLMGYRRDKKDGSPVFKHFEKPEKVNFRVKKHLVTFSAGDTDGYAIIGFSGLFQDAVFFDEKDEHYVLNQNRVSTHVQVYFPDEKGKMLVNPATGDITTLRAFNKMHKVEAEGEVNEKKQRWLLNEFGYIRVRRAQKNAPEECRVADNVKKRINTAFVHASNFSEVRRDSHGTTALTSAPESAFEGRPVSEVMTTQAAGRYLEYKTPSIAKTLEELKVSAAMGRHVLLSGPSGTGKSSLAKTLAIELERPYVSVQFHAKANESYALKKVTLTNGELVEVPLPLLLAFKYGWIAELRELNTAYFPNISFLNTLLDPNSTIKCEDEVIHRHPEFMAIATQNDYNPILHPGTRPLASSGINRFDSMLVTYPPREEERDLLVTVLEKENAGMITDKDPVEVFRDMFAIMAHAVGIVRDKLQAITDPAAPHFRILQRCKLSTDYLIDIARHSKSKREMMNRFLSRFQFSDLENRILEAQSVNPALSKTFADFNASRFTA